MALGMTKLGVRSCVYTRDIYKSVRRRGRAASCCTARVFSNSSSQCGDNKRETLRPDSRLQPPPPLLENVRACLDCEMFFSLSRPCFSFTVSPPVRRNTAREKQHGEKNLMASRGRMTSTSQGGAVGLLGGGEGDARRRSWA